MPIDQDRFAKELFDILDETGEIQQALCTLK